MARLQSQVELVAGEAGKLKDVTLPEPVAPSKKRPRRCARPGSCALRVRMHGCASEVSMSSRLLLSRHLTRLRLPLSAAGTTRTVPHPWTRWMCCR